MAKIKTGGRSLVSEMENPMSAGVPTLTPKNDLALLDTARSLVPAEFQDEEYELVEGAGVANCYMKFFHPMAKDSQEVMANLRGVRPGNPVLYYPDGGLELLNPLKFYMLHGTQYWTIRDSEEFGSIKDVGFEEQKGSDWSGEVTAVCLFFTHQGLVPTTCSFAGAKSPVAVKAINYRKLTKDQSWATLSADHKFASEISELKYRFTVTGVFNTKQTRDKKREYIVCDGVANPTTVGDLKLLQEMFADEVRVELLKHAFKSYKNNLERLKEIDEGNS